jgi:hypothetical protein
MIVRSTRQLVQNKRVVWIDRCLFWKGYGNLFQYLFGTMNQLLNLN